MLRVGENQHEYRNVSIRKMLKDKFYSSLNTNSNNKSKYKLNHNS